MTKKQKHILDAYLETGSISGTAKALGYKSRYYIRNTIKILEERGEVPWVTAAKKPPHLNCTKTTVQYDAKGNVVQEWKRLSSQEQMAQDIVDGLCEQVKGLAKAPKNGHRKFCADTLYEIDIYDAHIGMYADEKETLDANYDSNIAAERMIKVTSDLASKAEGSDKIVLVFGGDMLHSDNRSNKTEAGGHVLDVDTRYHRVVDCVIKACTEAVQICASVAKQVDIVVLEGNHSWHSEVWLGQVLSAYYSNCKNINVLLTPSPRKHMVWGNNLFVWAHGDRVPANKWPMIIAAEFAEDWGKTKYRYLKCGHVHHKKTIAPVIVDEQSGLVVEYLEALCAIDSWHTNTGFVGSQKGASAFAYDKQKGLTTRHYSNL